MIKLLKRLPGRQILRVVLLMSVFLISDYALAQEQSRGDQTSGEKQELPVAVPELAEIIPLSTKLYGRLEVLKNKLAGMPDVSEFQKKYDEIEANLKVSADQLQKFKDSKGHNYKELRELKEEIEWQNELFDKISVPLRRSISQLGTWRKDWLMEKENWNGWQSSMSEESQFDQIKLTLSKANDTINRALELIDPNLETMLTVQWSAGAILEKMGSLAAEIDSLLLVRKRSIIFDESPLMFSSSYFAQFRSGLWQEMQKGMFEITWPNKRFFVRNGWIIFLQGFLAIVVFIAIYRNRRVIRASERWHFLAARPFSAGLFLGFMMTIAPYEYLGVGIPYTWKVINTVIAGISFAQLAKGLVEKSWKRKFIYGLVIVYNVNKVIYLVALPLPLVRLYVLLTALVSFFLCLRWARESSRRKESVRYAVTLRVVSLFLSAIVIAGLFGKKGLALYLFGSLTDSITTLLVFMLFMYTIHGGVEWLFRSSPLRKMAVDDTDASIRRLRRFNSVAMYTLLLLPSLLRIFGVYDSAGETMQGFLGFGFNMGKQRITVGLVIVATGLLYGSFIASWIFQRVLVDKVLFRRNVEKGVRLSIGRLVHYAFIFVGVLLAISALGVEITKLTIMLSALGVGIGFGLQGVVNNFVSGLILLFERPIRVGDFIEFGGSWSEVKSIGLRSTTVQTFESSDIIIPNADLISNRVTNWTLTNRRRRLDIPVGVAYGSDISLVMKTLMACTKENTMLAEAPAPQILFLRFGDSSLNFELRVFVSDVRNSMTVLSELHQEIDRRFREESIEIAFPQRDLHLRSVDESVMLRPPETTG